MLIDLPPIAFGDIAQPALAIWMAAPPRWLALLGSVADKSSNFDAWLGSLDEEATRREISELRAEITKREQALALKRRLAGEQGDADRPQPRQQTRAASPAGRWPSTSGATAAVRALLTEDPTYAWNVVEMRQRMVTDGLLPKGAAGDQKIRSILQKLHTPECVHGPRVFGGAECILARLTAALVGARHAAAAST